jgi:hypothetical protein
MGDLLPGNSLYNKLIIKLIETINLPELLIGCKGSGKEAKFREILPPKGS